MSTELWGMPEAREWDVELPKERCPPCYCVDRRRIPHPRHRRKRTAGCGAPQNVLSAVDEQVITRPDFRVLTLESFLPYNLIRTGPW